MPDESVPSAPTSPQANEAPAARTYRTPGVYLQESFSLPQAIVGVSTAVAAFTGPVLQAPANYQPAKMRSYGEFVSQFGEGDLPFAGLPAEFCCNYLAMSVRAFFANGGTDLYIAPVPSSNGASSLPTVADYRAALATLEAVPDISVIAAPGCAMYGGLDGQVPLPSEAAPFLAELITHVSRTGYRFAVLDAPLRYGLDDLLALRSQLDTPCAALYHPWLQVQTGQATVMLPPSGFVCGIYARVDAERGVWAAPAGTEAKITGATGVEHAVSEAEQTVLNAMNVNSLRSFPGKGMLVWGARTLSSNTEWRYINMRRLLTYIEASIYQGTRWAVFEPNDANLWAKLRTCMEDFLNKLWRAGAFSGRKPEQAYYVQCGLGSTMTAHDILDGNVNCTVGIAALRPAEFIVFTVKFQVGAGG